MYKPCFLSKKYANFFYSKEKKLNYPPKMYNICDFPEG